MADKGSAVPAFEETERSVLAYVLNSSRGVEEWFRISDAVRGDMESLFHDPESALFCRAMSAFLSVTGATGGRFDQSLVADSFASEMGESPDEFSERLTVLSASSTITDRNTFNMSVSELVKESMLRQQIRVLEDGIESISSSHPDPASSIRSIRYNLEPTGLSFVDETSGFGSVMDRLDEQPSLSYGKLRTGLPELDRYYMGGFDPDRLYLVAGRPKMGKIITLVNMALSALSEGYTVFMVSMEIHARELRNKLVSAQATVPIETVSRWYDSGRNDEEVSEPEQLEAVLEADQDIRAADLQVLFPEDIPAGAASIAQKVSTWRSAERARRARNRDNASAEDKARYDEPARVAVFVDYIQLLDRPGEINDARGISNDAKLFKRMAMDEDAVVVVASQLNRGAVGGSTSASNLKGSGGLEEHPDSVIILNRPYANDMESNGESTASESDIAITVALNRISGTGTFHAIWLPDIQTVASASVMDSMYSDSDFQPDLMPDEDDDDRRSRRHHVDDMDL